MVTENLTSAGKKEPVEMIKLMVPIWMRKSKVQKVMMSSMLEKGMIS